MMRFLPLVLAGLMLWPTVVWAETPIEYRAALAETLSAAETAATTQPANVSLVQDTRLQEALQRLESIKNVTIDSGTTVTVSNDGLIKGLRGNRAEGKQAVERLRSLLRAIDAANERASFSEEIRYKAALDEVLARSEFRPDEGNPIGNFFDNLRTKISDWLNGLFPDLHLPDLSYPSPPESSVADVKTILFWVLLGVAVIFAVVFFGFAWLTTRRAMARYATADGTKIVEREDARAERLAAQRAADTGDYRLATHHLYQWVMLFLDERARWRYDRSLTNHEQIRLLPGDGEGAEPLCKVVDIFDRVWYGHTECTADEYGEFRLAAERVVEATT